MKIVASIQYTPTAYPDRHHAADRPRRKTGTSLTAVRFPASFIANFIEWLAGERIMGSARNEGEGNKTADRNYRKATTEFVQSERGKREIENAGNVSPEQEKDIRRAEEQAKQHAKEHDPAEVSRGQDAKVRSSRSEH
jgi:hypothetical protein